MIIRGPFNITWGGNTLEDIEAVEVQHENQSEDYQANSGLVYEIQKSTKVSVRLTFLANDIAAIAAVLPQYFVPQSEMLGDGTFVFDERGAIDVKADDCDTDYIFNDLTITSCGDPGESFKLLHARTIIDNIEVGKIRKIVIKFIGEPAVGGSIFQLLGDVGTDEFFQLGNDELFLLGNGENLIL